MPPEVISKDDLSILNQCTKYLARAGDPPRAGDEAAAAAYRDRIPEAWRFPVVDVFSGDPLDDDPFNEVTFLYKARPGDPSPVAVIGTFATLYEPMPLRPVQSLGEDTGYRALTLAIPKGEKHFYKYLVDGQFVLDPINPQREAHPNGRMWSRFFTDAYLQPVVLEMWEIELLSRLCDQILPFRTEAAENFLARFYFDLDRGAKLATDNRAYRLDESVGEVSAIDKMLAREEGHRLVDYKICLKQIDRVLRQRNPFLPPSQMSREYFIELYDQMAGNDVPGWDYSQYGSPQFFLQLLRRHVVTAAFSHPRYGGNVGAAGWAYLAEKYVEEVQGTPAVGASPPPPGRRTLFDWRAGLERPLGLHDVYR